VQEALTNVAKYAKASQVSVTLRTQGTHVEIAVRDDGVGFDPRATPPSTHGLLGMRYRLESEGGHMQLESAPGQGTQIRGFLPVRAAT